MYKEFFSLLVFIEIIYIERTMAIKPITRKFTWIGIFLESNIFGFLIQCIHIPSMAHKRKILNGKILIISLEEVSKETCHSKYRKKKEKADEIRQYQRIDASLTVDKWLFHGSKIKCVSFYHQIFAKLSTGYTHKSISWRCMLTQSVNQY